MSADTISHVWRYSPYTGSIFQVHVAIGDSTNDQNKNEIWMSVSTLAKKARVERRTAGKALAQLVEDGWLKVLSKPSGKVTRYRFVYKTNAPVVYESRYVEEDEEPFNQEVTCDDSTRVERPQVKPTTWVERPQDLGRETAGPGSRDRTNPKEPKVSLDSLPPAGGGNVGPRPEADVDRQTDPGPRLFVVPTSELSKEPPDLVKQSAHALTKLAFEQKEKPVIAGAPGKEFAAVMCIIEKHLQNGKVSARVASAIRAGGIVWTTAGLDYAYNRHREMTSPGPAAG